MPSNRSDVSHQCPTLSDGSPDSVRLAHGEGARLSRQLVGEIIAPLSNEYLAGLADGATLPPATNRHVFTTDSFVVTPLFFPRGDIGSLAVYGTVNDLAACGARPRWLSLALIIEEGLAMAVLRRVVSSIALAAETAGVKIVTGDTKVVPRGATDELFVNTAGIGELVLPMPGPSTLQSNDALIITGPVGCHGVAVLAAREQVQFEPPPASDCAPLFDIVEILLAAQVPVKAMRDATRGGVSAVLHEWADACGQTLTVDAQLVPVSPAVRGASELLGLDPLHVACEGVMVLAVAEDAAEAALAAIRQTAVGSTAAIAGKVVARRGAPVAVRRALGKLVPLDEPSGAPLPRIC